MSSSEEGEDEAVSTPWPQRAGLSPLEGTREAACYRGHSPGEGDHLHDPVSVDETRGAGPVEWHDVRSVRDGSGFGVHQVSPLARPPRPHVQDTHVSRAQPSEMGPHDVPFHAPVIGPCGPEKAGDQYP